MVYNDDYGDDNDDNNDNIMERFTTANKHHTNIYKNHLSNASYVILL